MLWVTTLHARADVSRANSIHAYKDSDCSHLLADIKRVGRPVYLKLSASWCGPCRSAAPEFEKLAQSQPGLDFYEINIESGACKNLAYQLMPQGVPFFLATDPKNLEKILAESQKVQSLRDSDSEDDQDKAKAKMDQLYRVDYARQVSAHTGYTGPEDISHIASDFLGKSAGGRERNVVEEFSRNPAFENSGDVDALKHQAR